MGRISRVRLGRPIARDTKGGDRSPSRHVRHPAPGGGAIVDVWQASPVGLYENQDPGQPDHNLRGRFETDAQGRFHFLTVRPAGYPVPTDGPCGELLRAQARHPYRPAHIHFMISRDGFKTLVTQVFANDDACIESDVVFGVTTARSPELRSPGRRHLSPDYDFTPARRAPHPKPIP